MLRMSPEAFQSLQAKLKEAGGRPAPRTKGKQKRKFHNEPTECNGMRFDSKAEAQRWHYLTMLQKAGEITELKHHVSFDLLPAQLVDGREENPVRYEADFTYLKGGKLIVEDVKSGPTKTREFILKRKLMLQVHGIAVIEVMAT